MEIKIALLICYLAYGIGFTSAIINCDLESKQIASPFAYIVLALAWPFWKGVVDGQAVNVRRELLKWINGKE